MRSVTFNVNDNSAIVPLIRMTPKSMDLLCYIWAMSLLLSADCLEIINFLDQPEKECFGTSVGFGFSGNTRKHYYSLRRRYAGCTFVRGNLELTNLDDQSVNYDLSFLRTIRVVTGYVLIGLVEVDIVPFLGLQLIRGDNLFKIHNESYGLAVVLTSDPSQNTGMRQLLMPQLRDISRGKVLFSQNPLLCYINTIHWGDIVRQHSAPVIYKEDALRKDCEECDNYCALNGRKHCWGPGSHNCQQVENPTPCTRRCKNGCYYSNGRTGCCHYLCAGGCWGPRAEQCQLCKYFYSENRCIRQCPPRTYPVGQQCYPL